MITGIANFACEFKLAMQRPWHDITITRVLQQTAQIRSHRRGASIYLLKHFRSKRAMDVFVRRFVDYSTFDERPRFGR
ncbi:hypothetical protein [Aporhodopirellula aestuarii]|uniref:Uncharacterized protein n=1 Tax=Aporhodopirellula aestuarii TaxID=2950107 RepID=A0ABT0U6T8_9BACT|nr:hypothetical protein [Aporhodopirellula aestuarii]MCM2372501.1 hypothetical protein [Aporhodopirellula aestuarii]